MTSFVLKSVQDRPPSYPPLEDKTCTFCRIIARKSEAFICYEDEHCMAFLDIYPMRPGHTLLIPKAHVARLADLPPTLGGVMGTALPRVVKAICEATGNPDLNVVCNQGYAQAVHVHWHLIPAPSFSAPSTDPVGDLSSKRKSKNKSAMTNAPTHQFMLRGEMANRDFLSDDEAEVLIQGIKSRL